MKSQHAVVLTVILVVAAMVGVLGFTGNLGSTINLETGGGPGSQELASAIDDALSTYDYSSVTVEFDGKSSLPGGQDDVDDWDIDVHGPWTTEANADMAKDYEFDCSGAVPVTWEGDALTVTLTKEDTMEGKPKMCKVNYHKVGRDFTIGDVESEIDDDIDEHEYDIGDKSADDSPGGGTDC